MVTVKRKLVWNRLTIGAELCCPTGHSNKLCAVVDTVSSAFQEGRHMLNFRFIRESVQALTSPKDSS